MYQDLAFPGYDLPVAYHHFSLNVSQIGKDHHIGVFAGGDTAKEVIKVEVLGSVNGRHLYCHNRIEAQINSLLYHKFHISMLYEALWNCPVDT